MARDFSDSGNPEVLTSVVDVVGNNLERILNIDKTTGFFDENLGTSIRNLNFQIMDIDLKFRAFHIIMSEVPQQEPRARIIPARSSVDFDHDGNILTLVLAFVIIGEDSDKVNLREILVRV